jgi:hypothetical protein
MRTEDLIPGSSSLNPPPAPVRPDQCGHHRSIVEGSVHTGTPSHVECSCARQATLKRHVLYQRLTYPRLLRRPTFQSAAELRMLSGESGQVLREEVDA